MSRFAFAERVRRIEQHLVVELALEPLPLPAELARMEGTFREQPATLEVRAYAGPRLGYVRCVEVRSRDLDIGNVLAMPRPELPSPVLGVDLVEVGRDTAVVVADLTPMTDASSERDRERDVLARHRLRALESSVARSPVAVGAGAQLPSWASEWFSTSALCVRVGADQAEASAAAVQPYVTAFIELVRDCAAAALVAQQTARRQQAYSAAHRERDRGLLLLRRIFEPRLADRFLGEVLFPDGVSR